MSRTARREELLVAMKDLGGKWVDWGEHALATLNEAAEMLEAEREAHRRDRERLRDIHRDGITCPVCGEMAHCDKAALDEARAALATMVDWAERGDQSLPDQFPRFCADLRTAQAALDRSEQPS